MSDGMAVCSTVEYAVREIVKITVQDIEKCDKTYGIVFDSKSWFHPILWSEIPGRPYLSDLQFLFNESPNDTCISLLNLILEMLNCNLSRLTNPELRTLCYFAQTCLSFNHQIEELLFLIISHDKVCSGNATFLLPFGRLVTAAVEAGCDFVQFFTQHHDFIRNHEHFFRVLRFAIASAASLVHFIQVLDEIVDLIPADRRAMFCYGVYFGLRDACETHPHIYRELLGKENAKFRICKLFFSNLKVGLYWPLAVLVIPLCASAIEEKHVEDFVKEVVKADKRQTEYQFQALSEIEISRIVFGVEWPDIGGHLSCNRTIIGKHLHNEADIQNCTNQEFCTLARYCLYQNKPIPAGFVDAFGEQFIAALSDTHNTADELNRILKLFGNRTVENQSGIDVTAPYTFELVIESLKQKRRLGKFVQALGRYLTRRADVCSPDFLFFLRSLFCRYWAWKGVELEDILTPMIVMLYDLLGTNSCTMVEHLLIIIGTMAVWSVYVGNDRMVAVQALYDLETIVFAFVAEPFHDVFEIFWKEIGPRPDNLNISKHMARKLVEIPVVLLGTKRDPTRALRLSLEKAPELATVDLWPVLLQVTKKKMSYWEHVLSMLQELKSKDLQTKIIATIESELLERRYPDEWLITLATDFAGEVPVGLVFQICEVMQYRIVEDHGDGYCQTLLLFIKGFLETALNIDRDLQKAMMGICLECLCFLVDSSIKNLTYLVASCLSALLSRHELDNAHDVFHVLASLDLASEKHQTLLATVVKILGNKNPEFLFFSVYNHFGNFEPNMNKSLLAVFADAMKAIDWSDTVTDSEINLNSLHLTFDHLLSFENRSCLFYEHVFNIVWIYEKQLVFLEKARQSGVFASVARAYFKICLRLTNFVELYKACVERSIIHFQKTIKITRDFLDGMKFADPIKYFVSPFLNEPFLYDHRIEKVNDLDSFVETISSNITWSELDLSFEIPDLSEYNKAHRFLRNVPEHEKIFQEDVHCQKYAEVLALDIVSFENHRVDLKLGSCPGNLDPLIISRCIADNIISTEEIVIDFSNVTACSTNFLQNLIALVPKQTRMSFIGLSNAIVCCLDKSIIERVQSFETFSRNDWSLPVECDGVEAKISFLPNSLAIKKHFSLPTLGVFPTVTSIQYHSISNIRKETSDNWIVTGVDKTILFKVSGQNSSFIAHVLRMKITPSHLSVLEKVRNTQTDLVPLDRRYLFACLIASMHDPIPEISSMSLGLVQWCLSGRGECIQMNTTFTLRYELLFHALELPLNSLRLVIGKPGSRTFLSFYLNGLCDSTTIRKTISLLIAVNARDPHLWAGINSSVVVNEALTQLFATHDKSWTNIISILQAKSDTCRIEYSEFKDALIGNSRINTDSFFDFIVFACKSNSLRDREFITSLFYSMASKYASIIPFYKEISGSRDVVSIAKVIVQAATELCLADKLWERLVEMETPASFLLCVLLRPEDEALFRKLCNSFAKSDDLCMSLAALRCHRLADSGILFLLHMVISTISDVSFLPECFENMTASLALTTFQRLTELFNDLSLFFLRFGFTFMKHHQLHHDLGELFKGLIRCDGVSEQDLARFHLLLVFVSTEDVDFRLFSVDNKETINFLADGLISGASCCHLQEVLQFLVDVVESHNEILISRCAELRSWVLRALTTSTDTEVCKRLSSLFAVIKADQSCDGHQWTIDLSESEARQIISSLLVSK